MAFSSRSAIRSATNFSNNLLRSFSTSTKSAHHNNNQQTHQYLEANVFVGSWEAPKNPKEAQARLAQLRRDYAKQVKQVRKDYIQEVELMRLEKQRKDEAKREELRVANEERKKLKAEVAKARAEERKVADEEFRRTLVSGFPIIVIIYVVRFYWLKISIGNVSIAFLECNLLIFLDWICIQLFYVRCSYCGSCFLVLFLLNVNCPALVFLSDFCYLLNASLSWFKSSNFFASLRFPFVKLAKHFVISMDLISFCKFHTTTKLFLIKNLKIVGEILKKYAHWTTVGNFWTASQSSRVVLMWMSY